MSHFVPYYRPIYKTRFSRLEPDYPYSFGNLESAIKFVTDRIPPNNSSIEFQIRHGSKVVWQQLPTTDSRSVLASDIRNHSPKIVERIATGLLHPDNKLSRAVFSEVTGISLPPTVGGTDRAIQASSPWGQLLVDYWSNYRKERDAKQADD